MNQVISSSNTPVDKQLIAYNARDLEGFIAAYSPEVVMEDGEGNLILKGHDKMRERYGALFEASPKLHCRIVNRIRIGKYVMDEEEVTGWKGSLTLAHAVVVYRVEGDKIVHVQMFT
jgi:hypothetical protein